MTIPRQPLKRLIVFRHAKAERGNDARSDFDRHLAPRGRRDAPRVARALARQGLVPDVILCSAAARTQETWILARETFPAQGNILIHKDFYLADATRLLLALRRVASDAETVMLIGHNPGLQELVLSLVGEDDAALRDRAAAKFPTAAAAVLEFGLAAWSALQPRSGRLTHLITPRTLDGEPA